VSASERAVLSNLHFKALSALRVGTCADLINLNDAANELWRVGVAQPCITLIVPS
jgi:hypothetical protein